ncbi:MAG: UDP-N-acetylmuramoyl-L-alanyl-D-glutamate--2,6-diaminopimelate ligase [Bacilli bacterium]
MIDIQSNSRNIKPGDKFIALRGILSDGHDYIKKAIENGASMVIVEEDEEYGVPSIVVADTREYLNQYLKDNYNKLLEKMNIIGITGTNGKSTTAMLIHDALNLLNQKTAYIGTIGFYIKEKIIDLPNTTVDICDTYNLLIQAYYAGCKNVIMELSSHGLATNRVKNIKFNIGIFTNLTIDHLNFHKNMENYALAKQILFKQIVENGYAIVNNDDDFKKYFLLEENKNVTYGFNNSDFTVEEVTLSSTNSLIKYKYLNNIYIVESSLVGKYNVYNLLACITCLTKLELDQNSINSVIPKLNAPNGRMDKINFKDNVIIIDYAHSPDSLEKVISTVNDFTLGNIYVVFGCTGNGDSEKRPIMTEIVGKYSRKFIITNDDPHFEDTKQIIEDMTKSTKLTNFEVCLDRKIAIKKGIDLLETNDALLILGKGHEEVMVIKNERIPFNDKKVVLEYLDIFK